MNVYLVTNLIDDKQYTGAEKRYKPDYFGSGKLIIEAIEKYGKENFKKEIIIDNKYIDSWEECREFEAACKLLFNTLIPNGYNKTWWEYPIPIEILIRNGKIAGKKTKELGVGIHAPGMQSKGGKRTHELHPEEQKEWGRKVGKITGKENKELKRGYFAPGMQSKGGKMRMEKLKGQGKFLEYQSKAGKIGIKKTNRIIAKRRKNDLSYDKKYRIGRGIGGKMSALVLFEIDESIQQTTLGAVFKI